jgi:hypothetical protein
VNPFARLINPAAVVPQPSTMQGRVHVLADDPDPVTQRPASRSGPKQGTHCPIVGLPRFELRYEQDESVTWADVRLPVLVAVTTRATVVTAPKLSGPGKAAPVLGDASMPVLDLVPRKLPAAGPGPKAYRVRAA